MGGIVKGIGKAVGGILKGPVAGIAKVAAPIVGGIVGGPAGASIGAAAANVLGGSGGGHANGASGPGASLPDILAGGIPTILAALESKGLTDQQKKALQAQLATLSQNRELALAAVRGNAPMLEAARGRMLERLNAPPERVNYADRLRDTNNPFAAKFGAPATPATPTAAPAPTPADVTATPRPITRTADTDPAGSLQRMVALAQKLTGAAPDGTMNATADRIRPAAAPTPGSAAAQWSGVARGRTSRPFAGGSPLDTTGLDAMRKRAAALAAGSP